VETIRRKTMLYKTGVEYGDYTMNHIQGCAHGCKYPCYAFLMAKRFGKVSSYEEWTKPVLVENTLDLLDIEIPKLKEKIGSVHLCITTDPFMYGYTPNANSELLYIMQETKKELPKLDPEEIKQILSMHEIQFGVNKLVLEISYAFSQHFEKEKNIDAARFFYSVLFDLTKDEEFKQKLELLGN